MTPTERASWGAGPQAPAFAVIQSGSTQVQTGPAPRQFGLLSMSVEDPSPMVLFIGGSVNKPAEPASASGLPSLKMLVEYGVGAASKRVEMDVRSGAYQLPVCEAVKVWVEASAGIAAYNFALTGAVARGAAVNTDVPMLTTRALSGEIPSGARAVELASPGRMEIDTTGQIIESDWIAATPVFAPPYSPVRIAGTTYSFVSAAGWTDDVCIHWLLSL